MSLWNTFVAAAGANNEYESSVKQEWPVDSGTSTQL